MGQILPEVTNYIPKAECPGSSDTLRAGFKGGPGGPGPRPPTNRGHPTKPVIVYLSFMLVVYKTDSLTHSLTPEN